MTCPEAPERVRDSDAVVLLNVGPASLVREEGGRWRISGCGERRACRGTLELKLSRSRSEIPAMMSPEAPERARDSAALILLNVGAASLVLGPPEDDFG